MLKKAGIAVAAAAAGLLAMSPLAFANGGDNHEQTGLVNVQDNVVQANVCDDNVNVLGIQVSDLTGALGLGLLAPGEAHANANTTCTNNSDN